MYSRTYIHAFDVQNDWLQCTSRKRSGLLICLFTPISYKKNYSHPYLNRSINRKKIYEECFLSVPVIHDSTNLPHVSSSIPIHTSLLSGGPPPYIAAAEQQASPRTLRDRRRMYSHTGQYDHTLSKKQLYQVTHSLYPENFTPKISLWLQLKHSIL